ncbi:MAG TPA: hypothetical protein ENL03_06925, partial [Phycisphaerae bacterium]|nr:hypothetical protein [Phycisphaerae bacterium]
PYVSILITSAFTITVIAILDIADLVKAASTMMLVLFLLVNLSVIIMRASKIQNYRPLYRSPFYPWLQLVGIGLYLFLIIEMIAAMGTVPLAALGAFLSAGALWYCLYVRTRIVRVSALVQLVRKVVSKEISHSHLDKELLEIALDRDEITRDRFDHIIADSPILDIPEAIDASEMFCSAAAKLAERLKTQPKALEELFNARETESSTVIQPGLAIPHVIVDGRNIFDVLLFRCKGGVMFPGQDAAVHVGFVLAGSKDQRNFHLRALMAVSNIVSEPEFFRRWMTATSPEALRDIVLLSSRQRDAES